VRRLSNLALYHLAAGEVERSNGLWAQAFALPDATAYIRGTALNEGVRDAACVGHSTCRRPAGGDSFGPRCGPWLSLGLDSI
jgi:hypothetical protein